MAAPKGHPRYGERTKRSLNRPNLAREPTLKRMRNLALGDGNANMTPLEAMLLVMRWAIEHEDRAAILAAASASAPYCHPRYQSVLYAALGPDGQPVTPPRPAEAEVKIYIPW